VREDACATSGLLEPDAFVLGILCSLKHFIVVGNSPSDRGRIAAIILRYQDVLDPVPGIALRLHNVVLLEVKHFE
jgi:hypothetical protein